MIWLYVVGIPTGAAALGLAVFYAYQLGRMVERREARELDEKRRAEQAERLRNAGARIIGTIPLPGVRR